MARARSFTRVGSIAGTLRLLPRNAIGLAAAAVCALLLVSVWSPAQAEARSGWELCNETSFVLEAATGRPEGRRVIVEGWIRLRPGECRVAMPAPLKPGVVFMFARSSAAHRAGQREWNGDVPLCVDATGSFAVESPSSCGQMGLESRLFQAVKIENKNAWRNSFRETEQFGLERARGAGLQRLLLDAGLDNAPIDGYLGRTARTAVTNFLQQKKLPISTSEDDLIDILEDVARNRSLEVGMMLCNRTDHRIWTAIARLRADGWESRGWWTLEGGACVRTVDESLISTPHYVYARMETPQGVRELLNAKTSFCTSRTKFAISGRERCEARYYREDDFVETPAPADGKLVYEFFERSFAPPQKAGR